MNDFEIVPQKIRVRGLFFVALSASFCALLRLTGFHDLFRNDAEGVGALLAIIGTLYSVVYAFATYVIWGQFAAVEDEIVKESGALKDLILFSRPLHDTVRDPIVRAVRGYARGVIESEWGLLSRRENTERTDHLFSNVISSVTEAKPSDEPESRVHNLLLKIAKQASAHREERLAVSAKRMPRTLLLFVSVTAMTIPFCCSSTRFTTWRSAWSPSESRPCFCLSRTSYLRTLTIRSRAPGTWTPMHSTTWPANADRQ